MELHKAQPKKSKSMSTNNNECYSKCECLLHTFSHNANVSRLRKFFSKGHEEQHCLSSSKSVSCIINNINCSKTISQRNDQWASAEKKKQKGRIKEKN